MEKTLCKFKVSVHLNTHTLHDKQHIYICVAESERKKRQPV